MASLEQLRDRLVSGAFHTAQELYVACLDALDHGLYEEISARLQPALTGAQASHAGLWQVYGLALQGMQDLAGAHQAMSTADRLRPNDPLIVHSVARMALEGGKPAAAAYGRARMLLPDDPGVLTGQAAALLAEGQGGQALDELARVLNQHPAWLAGHATYARIAAMCAPDTDPLATYRAALSDHPQSGGLWLAVINTALQASDIDGALRLIDQARSALGPISQLSLAQAHCLSERGQAAEAQILFEALPQPANAAMAIYPLRNLIRLGRYDDALVLAEQSHDPQQDLALWPYRALLWRLRGDPRWDWLEGEPALIRTFDLTAALGPLDELAALLRDLHHRSGQPIDQSVRGGSQTDGNLLSRIEPEIRRLRGAIIDAVGQYVAGLPPPRAGHPTLLERRAPLRIEGAWSVRLTGHGFHVDHVHHLGWISSALYIVLPEGEGGIGRAADRQDGWLTFGECLNLVPDLPAFRVIEPKAGTMVLFPSTLWHGTRPFGAGERLTVAMDIARPTQ